MIEVREESVVSSESALVITCTPTGSTEAMARCVDLAVRLGHTRLVVDLDRRSEPDSNLLSALHHSGLRMREVGGRLSVVCADSRFRRLLDLTLLSAGFSVYSTRDEALAG
ncbi:MAG TPA: hypothetical protein VEW90_10455 [Gaiellaceae bacterium]|nr:hypothetical protein [Gaiellaceae bacterium]